MFTKTVFRSNFLVQWNARMSKDNLKPLTDKVVEAVLYEQGIPFVHTDEFRSLYSVDKLYDQLRHYEPEFRLDMRDACLQAGLKDAFRIFTPKVEDKLKPVNLTQTVSELMYSLGIKEDKSAGITAYGMTKGEAFTIGLDKAIDILLNGKTPGPCLAGARTQRKGKTRLVWMYPLEMTIIEAIVARPLINYFKGIEHTMTFGDYSHETGMRLRRSASSNRNHVSIDYSQFDSTISRPFITKAFSAFRKWFDLDDEVYPGVTVGKVFEVVERYFIYTPILMPNPQGKYPILYRGKNHGVPSGSYFTQIVDSFANVSALMAASRHLVLNIKEEDLNVLGDDCLFFCNSNAEQTVQNVSRYLRTLGFSVNPDKGSRGVATADIEYLGRVWRNGFPIRPFSDLIRGALYPEKFRRYSQALTQKRVQAQSVFSSYLLTSYVEGAPVGTENFVTVTANVSSGYTRYLMEEGFIPGQVLTRAIY